MEGVYADSIAISKLPEEYSTDQSRSSSDDDLITTGETSVQVSSQTQFQNIAGMADLKIGDAIKVEYIQDPQRKVATFISRAEHSDRYSYTVDEVKIDPRTGKIKERTKHTTTIHEKKESY